MGEMIWSKPWYFKVNMGMFFKLLMFKTRFCASYDVFWATHSQIRLVHAENCILKLKLVILKHSYKIM